MASPEAGTMVPYQPTQIEPGQKFGDRELLARFVACRDEGAFTDLVQRHGAVVWGVCRRVLQQEQDAEDAFQATLLTLARKAESIRKGEAVGSWLYGVAYRIAMKARKALARRHECEQQATTATPEQAPPNEAAFRELQRLLDEELHQLPEKYRAPFVLCCLEGLSKGEAARELGWKEGTVSTRVARARKQLQSRLMRRGVTLATVLAAVAVAPHAAAAPALVHATIHGVLAPLGSQAAGNTLSPAAVALSKGMLHTVAVHKVSSVLVPLALAVLLAGLALAGLQLRPAPQQVAEAAIVHTDPEMFRWPAVSFWSPIDEQILSLAISPDGKKLVTAGARHTSPGQLMIWDLASGKNLLTLRGIPGVRTVAYSPDGRTLATGDFRGAITLRDADTGKERTTLNAHHVGVNGLAFSADSKWLVSAGLDHLVKRWDLNALSKEPQVFVGHPHMVHSVAFFRHGKTFVTGGRDNAAIVWDIATGKEKLRLEGHAAAIESVAVSPDDRMIATGSWDQTIRLWDAETGRKLGVLEGSDGSILSVAFSPPDGKRLASATLDGSISLWDVKTQKPVQRLGGHRGSVWAVAFTPNGKLLASGSSDRTAALWDVAGTKKLKTFDTASPAVRPLQALTYAPDGQVVGMATDDNSVQIRDAETGEVLFSLAGHTAPVTCLAFSPDSQLLASASADRTVKLWERATGKEMLTLKGHGGAVRAVVYSLDGKKLASAGDDGAIKWWDVNSGKALTSIKGHDGSIHALALSPDGSTLASGGADRLIRLWKVDNDSVSTSLKGHEGAIRALAFAADGTLASASEDGTVKVWLAASLWRAGRDQVQFTLKRHTQAVWALSFSPRGKTLVSGGQDGALIVWDPASGQSRGILKGHKGPVTALAMHPQGSRLLSGSQDTTVLSWLAAPAPSSPGTLAESPMAIRFARFSPGGERLASGGDDGTVTLWARSAESAPALFRYPEQTWSAHSNYLSCGLFLDNGKTLATGSWDNTIRLWDVNTGQAKATLLGHKAGIRSLAVLLDGKTLVSASEDATVKLWDLGTCKEKGTLKGNAMVAYCLAVSPDRKTLASAGGDHRRGGPGELILWDVETGKPRKTFPGIETAWGLAFSPDGKLLAAAFVTGVIQVWDVDTGVVRASLQAPYVRPVTFSPDGKLLAAGYGKAPFQTEPGIGGVLVWDTTDWQERAALPEHEHVVFTVDFSPDGKTLISASQDGRIKLWSLAQITSQARSKPALQASGKNADEQEQTPAGAVTPAAENSRKKKLIYDLSKNLETLSAATVFGPDADTVMQTDAQGLRITLPEGRSDCRNVGVELPLRLHGDFSVDLGFELLAIGKNIADPAAGVQMRLTFDAPSSSIVALARLRNRYGPQRAALFKVVGHDGETFASYNVTISPDGGEKQKGIDVRAREPRGRLKFVRTGSQLQSLVSDGRSPYHLIKAEEIGKSDVEMVRFFAYSGWAPVAVDVRFTDLVISADELPDGMPGGMAWSRAWLAGVMAAGLVLSLACGAWLHVRRSGRA